MEITKNKIIGIDHLRGLAIFLVFFFHYTIVNKGEPQWLADNASFGWIGVDLFFVISGYLISSQLFAQIKSEKKISFVRFFIKRFFRIIPAFVATIAIYFLIPAFREKESLPPLWKFLTFTQNLGLNIQDQGTFSHCWSLCVEEHFYLLFPIILILLQRLKLLRSGIFIIIGLFIAGFIIRHISYNNFYLPYSTEENGWMYWYKFIYYPTYNRIDGLIIGVSVAAFETFKKSIFEKTHNYSKLFFIIGTLLLFAANFLCEEQSTYNASIFGFPLIALGFGSILISILSPNNILHEQKQGMNLLAPLSYSIYLTHKGVIHVINNTLNTFDIPKNLLFVLTIIACLIFAYLMQQIIEKPFMKLRVKIENNLNKK